jgi:hypothetical protein
MKIGTHVATPHQPTLVARLISNVTMVSRRSRGSNSAFSVNSRS